MAQQLVARRASPWLARWGGLLPLFAAELILWLGFGALLPILPLYFTDQGVDLVTLGVVVAAWPAARLVGEPLFGVVADRTRRVPLMVIGLVGSGCFAVLPIAVHGPVAFAALRALAGLFAAMYDPAARGYLVDASEPNRRGEAFGLYSAAQMGGLLLGPALGGLGAAATGNFTFVFWMAAVAAFVAALAIALTLHERPHAGRSLAVPPTAYTELGGETQGGHDRGGAGPALDTGGVVGADAAPHSLRNRALSTAIVLNFGALFAGGTYEVIWSLFMRSRGFSVEFIGLTFALYGVPVLLLSPFVGRLVDRRGTLVFVLAGSAGAIAAGFLYTVIDGAAPLVAVVLLESSAWALVTPALYAVVALGSPGGRSSTAQGIFGSAGTIAFIISSLIAGRLFELDWRYPFWLFSAVMAVTLGVALLIGRGSLQSRPRTAIPDPGPG